MTDLATQDQRSSHTFDSYLTIMEESLASVTEDQILAVTLQGLSLHIDH